MRKVKLDLIWIYKKMFVVLSGKKKQQNLPLKIFIPYFVAFLVFSGMEVSSKLSKNSFEISTKREAADIVLESFQNRRILLLDDYY